MSETFHFTELKLPNASFHLGQAQHNLGLLKFFKETGKESHFSDWCVTVSFYAAVHMVEALIFTRKKFSCGAIQISIEHADEAKVFFKVKSAHAARNDLLRDNSRSFPDLYSPYSSLYNMSRVARYHCRPPSNHDFATSARLLARVRNACESVIGQIETP